MGSVAIKGELARGMHLLDFQNQGMTTGSLEIGFYFANKVRKYKFCWLAERLFFFKQCFNLIYKMGPKMFSIKCFNKILSQMFCIPIFRKLLPSNICKLKERWR